jgi:hypothetical protein
MTPRTIENKFSELLINQLDDIYPLDLTLEGPITHQIHPKILWSRLIFENNPEQDHPDIIISGWSFECFPDLLSAKIKYPNITNQFLGKPWCIQNFVNGGSMEALIDFKDFGTVYLTKKPLSVNRGKELHDLVLPQWLSYVLSSELWGAQGKWTRFHLRLHQLFKTYHLLTEPDFAGYYPLESRSEILESFGFKGSRQQNKYLLVLPWSFSISSLKKLEDIISQEF